MNNNNIFNNRGSTMLEAAIVFPLIILSLIALIYILINMYYQTCLQSVVDMSSEKSSYYLSGTIEGMDFPESENHLYYNFTDNNSELRRMEAYTKWYMQRLSLYREKRVLVDFGYHYLYPKIVVSIKAHYNMPLFQNGQGNLYKTTMGTYYIHDEAEFIRNVDLIADVVYTSIDNIFKEAMQKSKTIGEK